MILEFTANDQWTAHHHILQACNLAGVMLGRDAITTAEHKVNGKTKGLVSSFYRWVKYQADHKMCVPHLQVGR